MKKFSVTSAKNFEVSPCVWEFPFECLDATPGGSNLGRIEWGFEPVKFKKQSGRWYITSLLLWARQTRDKRYAGKLFRLPCMTEAITGDSINPTKSLIGCVWIIKRCPEHKGLCFAAYPRDGQSILRVDLQSSISGTLELKYIELA